MATYTWVGDFDTGLQNFRNYDPEVTGSVNTNNLMVFNPAVAYTYLPDRGGPQQTPGSIKVMAGFASFTVSGTDQVFLSAQNYADGYSLKIEDNNSVTFQSDITQVKDGNYNIYVGTNSTFRLRQYGIASSTGKVRKFGPGTMYMGWNVRTDVLNANPNGVDIISGTLAIRGSDFSAATDYRYIWGTGALGFDSSAGTLNIESGGGSKVFSNSLSLPNGATFKIDSGSTLSFNNSISAGSNAALVISGSGTLSLVAFSGITYGSISITAGGTLTLGSSTTVAGSMSFTSGGILTVGSGGSFTGSTLSGNGTINQSGADFWPNAAAFSGTLTGTFQFRGGGTKGFGGNFTGYPSVTDADGLTTLTISGTSSGNLDTIYSSPGNRKTVIVTGAMNGTSFPNSALRLGTEATLTMSGAAASVAGSVTLGYGSVFSLANGATAAFNMTNVFNGAGYIDHYINADASSFNKFNGNITMSDASITSGSLDITVASNGTLTWGGAAQTISAGNAGRVVTKKGAGIWRISSTSGLTVTTCAVNVSAGSLHINTAATATFNAGLNIANNSTLACSSTNSPYAAQITGNVALAAGSTLRFGAPA